MMNIRLENRNIILEKIKAHMFYQITHKTTLSNNSQNMFCNNLNGRDVQHCKLIHKPTKFTEQL